MIDEKGLAADVADEIGKFVCFSGQDDLVEQLLLNEKLTSAPAAVEGLKALKVFFEYAELYKVKIRVKFDMSLARGLDYYTGIIYEAVLTGNNHQSFSFSLYAN